MKKEKIRNIIQKTKKKKNIRKLKIKERPQELNCDSSATDELSKETENRSFIEAEIKRIAKDYKISEKQTALYTGQRFIWFGYCSKERGLSLEKLEGEELVDEIMNIASSKESDKDFDWKDFFQGVDGDLMEDFATIQLSQLPIWDEMLEFLEGKGRL